MATIIDLPRRAFDTTRSLAMAPVRPLIPAGMVDEWGRDEHVIRALSPLLRLRWNASVGGENRLPTRAGALLVTNDRRLSFSPLYVSWALAEATGRPVRFVGHPDIVPFGPAMRRLGAILRNPTEVRGALHHGELVVLAAAPTNHPRYAGTIDPALVGAAVMAGVGVFPVASMSSPLGRSTRVQVGAQVRLRTKRRGPLAEHELAEHTQRHLQRMLDELGGVQTGMTAIDWLGEG
jgi:1-acyl-sn-glycerol-3-phosphate acyltransferase